MKILAIDTCSDRLTVLLAEDGVVLSSKTSPDLKQHSAVLLPYIGEVLRDCRCTLASVDCFGAVRGAGSFTGIRVGLSTIKAFCYALGKPAVSVTSLECLAYNGGKDENAAAVADAKQGKVYLQFFCRNVPVTDIEVVDFDLLDRRLSDFPDAAVRSNLDIAPFTGRPFSLEEDISRGLTRALFAAKQVAGEDLAPLYVRKAQAEEERHEI